MRKIVFIVSVIFIMLIIGGGIYISFMDNIVVGSVNDTDIYSKKSEQFILLPFNMEIDPMERLMLITFEDDMDEIYNCFEIQSFDDDKSGQGIRIIAYRNDKFVDVYQQPSLTSTKGFEECGKGLADLVIVPLEDALFEIDSKGVNSYFNFIDKKGREIEVKIKEENTKKPKPFDLLAPLGEGATAPSSLPIYLLYDFYFVRKDKTEMTINIDGKTHKPDDFGMPLDGSKFYFIRYSEDPFLVQWNSAYKGLLEPVEIDIMKTIELDNIEYKIVNNNGYFEIQSMQTRNEEHEIKVEFLPSIPDISCLKDGKTEGEFAITSDKSVGKIRGKYSVLVEGNKIKIKVNPNKGWKPNENRLMLNVMYRFVPVFKDWSKNYEWTANIELNEDNTAVIETEWNKK